MTALVRNHYLEETIQHWKHISPMILKMMMSMKNLPACLINGWRIPNRIKSVSKKGYMDLSSFKSVPG